MPHDWETSKRRLAGAMLGSSEIDRIPFFPLACEEMICRISGKTFRELVSSPKIYANAAIKTYEFLNADTLSIPTAYAGPAEALAFAEANDKEDVIKWSDYKVFMAKQGAICKTEEDIDNLQIPDHRKISLWDTCISAVNVAGEKTKFPQACALGIWSVVQELRGVQAYRDMRRNPDLLLKLCEKVYESQMDVYDFYKEVVGPSRTIFFTGYAFNKHMMSFEDAMKYEGQFIKRIQEKTRARIVLHNCGTSPYFDEMCNEIKLSAINGSHPLDIGYWVEFKQKHPDVVIIGANIDVSRELFNGTQVDVENKVKENIMHLAPGGRYVVGPICCLPWGVSLNNVMAIPRAIKKWGTYPLKFN
ncbi:MAG: uroporphyrinogen decarboxylase family protein [Promethearchaeota archaeon]|jgi:uroporphyrinogen-III decarboxylase